MVNNKNSEKRAIYIILGVILIIVASFGIYFYSVNKAIDSWKDRIYPKISINGVEVGGKTKEEARKLININVVDKVNDKKLTLESEGEEVVIEYSKIKPEYKVEEALDKALAYGKDEGIFTQNAYIKKGLDSDIEVLFGYDEKVVENSKKELEKRVNKPAKDATLDLSGNDIKVVEGTDGEKINKKKMDEIVAKSISGDIDKMEMKVNIPIEKATPAITGKMLSKIDYKIGSSTTNFNTGDTQRVTNLRLATDFINGTIVMPGETFSYNEVVGERTTERGFREGAAFVGNQVVPSIGGGVCQISTTLYQAVTRSGIPPTERHNHSMPVSYASPGQDATVAWDYLDYKFKNIYNVPVYIQGYLNGGSVTFNIYGNKEQLKGNKYSLVSVQTESINPGIRRIEDPSMPKGTQKIEKRACAGSRVNGYLVAYKDGKEVDRALLSKDIYGSAQGIVRYGIG